jgi:hypothetical protein
MGPPKKGIEKRKKERIIESQSKGNFKAIRRQ